MGTCLRRGHDGRPALTPRTEPASVDIAPRHRTPQRGSPMTVELEALESRSRELLSTAGTILPGRVPRPELPAPGALVRRRPRRGRPPRRRPRPDAISTTSSGPARCCWATRTRRWSARSRSRWCEARPSTGSPSRPFAWRRRWSDAVPCAEQVRFVSTGTEATMFACRMARAVTRREKILKFEGGWHGFHDYAMAGNWRVPSEAPYPYAGPGHRRHPAGEPWKASWSRPSTTSRRPSASRRERGADLAAIIVEPLQRVPPSAARASSPASGTWPIASARSSSSTRS